MKKLLFFAFLGGCVNPGPGGKVPEQTVVEASHAEHIDISQYDAKKLEPNALYMLSADWCKPCQIAKPLLEKETKAKGDRLIIVDANNFKLLVRNGYNSLPIFIMTDKDGKQKEYQGWNEEEFLRTYRSF
jgi:thiol-disulfide isomerase/thioredoxin